MHKSVTRAALPAVTLGIVLAPIPAFAQELAISDGTGDAWEETLDPAPGSYTYTPAGSPVNSDILRAVVRHRAHSVQVRTVFTDLRNNDQGVIDGIRIRTNEGLHREVWVTKEGGTTGSKAALLTPRGRR